MILKIRQLLTQKNKFESMMLALLDEMYSKNTPLRMLIFGQEYFFLGPTIFGIPQPN